MLVLSGGVRATPLLHMCASFRKFVQQPKKDATTRAVSSTRLGSIPPMLSVCRSGEVLVIALRPWIGWQTAGDKNKVDHFIHSMSLTT